MPGAAAITLTVYQADSKGSYKQPVSIGPDYTYSINADAAYVEVDAYHDKTDTAFQFYIDGNQFTNTDKNQGSYYVPNRQRGDIYSSAPYDTAVLYQYRPGSYWPDQTVQLQVFLPNDNYFSYADGSVSVKFKSVGLDPGGSFSTQTIIRNSSASLPAGWTYSSSNTAVGAINGTTFYSYSPGSTTITATSTAGWPYQSKSLQFTYTVYDYSQPGGSFSISDVVVGQTATLAPTGSKNTAGWSYSSSDPSVASVSGSTLTAVKVGTATITATQPQSGYYYGQTLTATVKITALKDPGGTFTIGSIAYGSTATLGPTGSQNTAAWTYTSSDSSVAAISGSKLSAVKVGTATITASQPAKSPWAAKTLTAHVTVTAIAPTIKALTITSNGYLHSGTSYPITNPTSNSSGGWTYTSSDTSVVSITSSNQVSTATATFPGTVTITATQAAAGDYTSGSTTATVYVILPYKKIAIPCGQFADMGGTVIANNASRVSFYAVKFPSSSYWEWIADV